MNKEIIITYSEKNSHDLPEVVCFERDDDKTNYLRVAYVGLAAEELIKIVTEPGYLDELLKSNKPDTRPLNKITVHFRDGSGKEDEIWMYATDIVLDDPEYLILTNDGFKKFYFNKKDVIYFEMEADRG